MYDQKVFVSVYCKLPDDSFSHEMVNQMAQGKEIYDFLMKDAGLSFDEKGELIPGDSNIWYLGCNDQFGGLQYKDLILSWEIGDSTFARVEAFVSRIYLDQVFDDDQYRDLMNKCYEGRQIDYFRDIPAYFRAKREGRQWIRSKEALHFREKAKRFVSKVHDHLQGEGFMFIDMTGRSL